MGGFKSTGAPSLEAVRHGVYEIERHLHGWERWLGLATVPTATHVADRMGTTVTPFQMDAGNNTWGTWLQVLGEDDTPIDSGNTRWDFHFIQFVAIERFNSTHFIQVAIGASGAAALVAGTYSDLILKPNSAQGRDVPLPIMMRRGTAGDLCWMRTFVPGQNTGTVDFWIGLHEYTE